MFLKIIGWLSKAFDILEPLIKKWIQKEEARPIISLHEANDKYRRAQLMPQNTPAQIAARKEAIRRAAEDISRATSR